MGTVSRVHTFASGAILTAAQLNNEFDNLLTSSAINGGLDATNLGVTAGQATASKALVVDASRNLADATGSNRINNLALSGTFESTGAITASAGITSGGNIVSDTDSTDDLGTTGVRWANLFVDDVTVTNNVTIGGTLTLTGGITLNGNTTIGDSSADTLTVNSTITSNLIFTDATYDIGASGATRPRDLHLSRNALMGGTLGVTGLITATGGVSGALTGNVTGDLSGNVTGGTISGTTGTFSGATTVGAAGTTADFAVWTDGTSSTAAGFTVDASADEVIVGQLSGGGNTNFKVRNRLNNTVFQVTPDAPSTTVFAPNIATGSAGTLTVKTGSINSDSIRLEAGGTTSTWLESRGYLGHSWYVDSTRSMTLDATGLGLGTVSPTHTLDVNGSVQIERNGASPLLRFTDTSSSSRWIGIPDGSSRFAIYGTNGSTEEFVLSGGNVGIGTSSPDGTLHVHTGSAGSVTAHGSADDLVIEHASDAGLSILTPAANNGRIYFGSPTNNAYGQIDYDHATNDMVFATAGSGKLTITGAGNVGIGTSSPEHDLVVSDGGNTGLEINPLHSSGTINLASYDRSSSTYKGLTFFGDEVVFRTGIGTTAERARILSSGGITFNGDTTAANALDDYEEGTIQPTLTPSTSGSITTGNNRVTLQYTKIGNVVHIQGFLEVTSVSSPVGIIQVPTGFTPAGTQTSDYTAGTCIVSSSTNSLKANQYTIIANESYTYLQIFATDGIQFGSDAAQSIGSAADIYINITYIVA
jgi:hypothetical protein